MRVALLALLVALPALAAMPAAEAGPVGARVCFQAIPAPCIEGCVEGPEYVTLCKTVSLPL